MQPFLFCSEMEGFNAVLKEISSETGDPAASMTERTESQQVLLSLSLGRYNRETQVGISFLQLWLSVEVLAARETIIANLVC